MTENMNVFRLIDYSASPGIQLKSLAINQAKPEMLAVAMQANDVSVPVYDRRNVSKPMLRLLPTHLALANRDGADEGRAFFRSSLVTHVAFNTKGDELIANIGSENIYVFSVEGPSDRSPGVFEGVHNFLFGKENGDGECRDGEAFGDVVERSVKLAANAELAKAIDICSCAYQRYSVQKRYPLERERDLRLVTCSDSTLSLAPQHHQCVKQQGRRATSRSFSRLGVASTLNVNGTVTVTPRWWTFSTPINCQQKLLKELRYTIMCA